MSSLLAFGMFVVAATAPAPAVARMASQTAAPPVERVDEEYTRLIREHLQDERITTELVDALPASDTVPSPLEFLGRVVGTPGELTYARDIQRYYEALDVASPRARLWTIGRTEEGRDIVALAIADEETIATIDRHKEMLHALTDPRRTSDADAAALLDAAKPVYYLVSGMHSTENGGPEMLIELAYRLIVQETPFVQAIRRNVITLITPVIEVDGREKQVDTYYYNKGRPQEERVPLMYWGKYVQHDNNRDGMGQFLELTKAVTRLTLEWRPTITHDLHEAQTYLYTSTGTGPYNEALDPITISEWWMLAQNDVLEMTKRNVPGVWTYGFYDGWVPNYMIFIAHSHNAIGRFYEVQGYGPDPYDVRPGRNVLSREWFRPNPPLASIRWGPRNNTNIQQSAVLLSLHHVATNRRLYIENYWLKNKRSVEKGRTGPVHAWVIPAGQRRKADTATAVNDLRRQGLEISRASRPFTAGDVDVQAGDYIVRADQPFRTLAEMYFSIQNYPPQNPSPYDDTGWTFPLMRNIRIVPVTEKTVLDQPMTRVVSDVTAAGGVMGGAGRVLVVDHTSDNAIVTFRFRHADVRMLAARADFDVADHRFRAGALIVPDADRARLEPTLVELGLSAWAVGGVPEVETHDLDVPRIGYVHSWSRTQDEGWWRAALDTYGVPYTYFADQKLREGNLRDTYDVILFPHVGGSALAQVNGVRRPGTTPVPYRRTEQTPNLGGIDESDDIRGGMGIEGLAELAKFVEQGGLLITEGSTATIFPEYGMTNDVTIEQPSQLFVRGSIVRSRIADASSPLAYGYLPGELPVYFNQAPVIRVGNTIAPPPAATSAPPGGRGAAPRPNVGLGQIITPNATPLAISPFEPDEPAPLQEPRDTVAREVPERPGPEDLAALRERTSSGRARPDRPRVILEFASDASKLLLSGTLVNGELLAGRAALVDVPLGEGHVVLFAIRPFWRWQTHGTYPLGFNAILNWNDLD
jgi:hypothetical protein